MNCEGAIIRETKVGKMDALMCVCVKDQVGVFVDTNDLELGKLSLCHECKFKDEFKQVDDLISDDDKLEETLENIKNLSNIVMDDNSPIVNKITEEFLKKLVLFMLSCQLNSWSCENVVQIDGVTYDLDIELTKNENGDY